MLYEADYCSDIGPNRIWINFLNNGGGFVVYATIQILNSKDFCRDRKKDIELINLRIVPLNVIIMKYIDYIVIYLIFIGL